MADVERERRHHAAAYHPVLSDEPIEILQPRRRMIKIALINALAIIVASVAAAMVAGSISNDHITSNEKKLMNEINRRSELSDEQDERVRRVICVLLRHERPTPDIRLARVSMKCR